jgi:ankyrin repeat protein
MHELSGSKHEEVAETSGKSKLISSSSLSGLATSDVYQAASAGHINALLDVLPVNDGGSGSVSLEFMDPQDRTPLLIVCTNGYVGCATILLQHGANLAAVDIDGNTALHVACMHGAWRLSRCY